MTLRLIVGLGFLDLILMCCCLEKRGEKEGKEMGMEPLVTIFQVLLF